MKQTEETFTSIPVGKIVAESNRKHGGMGNIAVLAASIKAEGLINPPTVTANKDGTYRVIAGRRRYEAVKSLGYTTVEVRVYPDEADEAAIALAENVNRQEMHPLDEAETFKKLIERGTAVEDIAAYYDRTVAGIQHRVRLCHLTEGVREMFRVGKINLSGAALIASLPPENQEKFLKKFGGEKSVNKWDISLFMQAASKLTLDCISGGKCENCRNRTRNTTPGLFEDYCSLNDVCFDADCYAERWRAAIRDLITGSGDAGNTENNIILDRDIPRFVPPKTAALNLDGDEYTLLSRDSYTWKETEKKAKKDTAWLVSIKDGKVTASRVAYKKYERTDYGNYRSAPADPVKEYLIDQAPEIREEDRKAVVEKIKATATSSYRFRHEVRERVLRAVIGKRLKEESRENLAAAYLIAHRSGEDASGRWREIDPDHGGVFNALFGPEGIAKPGDIPPDPLIQKVFLFLIATGIGTNEIPDLDDSEEEWAETEASLFWKFAQMEREAYLRLYREILTATIRAAAGMGLEATEGPERESAWAEEPAADATGDALDEGEENA